jgi:hypothetical protein
MKIRVTITETSCGAVTVDVPEGASEDEIYDAAYEAYCEGNAWFGDSNFDVTGWEEE